VLPRLLGKISRNSEFKSMQLDKIKGTLVDFNQLETVLDDAPSVISWQLELRKANDDPMELDELILHIRKTPGVSDDKVTRELNSRCLERIEIRPNRILFHDADEMTELLGIGRLLKEQKVVDNRPKKSGDTPKIAESPGTSGTSSLSPSAGERGQPITTDSPKS
jgi:hypothetical protein